MLFYLNDYFHQYMLMLILKYFEGQLSYLFIKESTDEKLL